MNIDLHTHTVASRHAFSTVKEMAEAAAERGLKIIGISDHGPAMPLTSGYVYFICGNRIPKTIAGVRVLFGIEANIIDDKGNIDISSGIVKKLDYVIAGFHLECGFEPKSIEKNTAIMIKTIQNPYVDIISHPYSTQIPVDIEKVAEVACKEGKILEINVSYFSNKHRLRDSLESIKKMIEIFKKHGKKLLINTDAHSCFEVGDMSPLLPYWDNLGLTEDILYNYDLDSLKDFLSRNKKLEF
jgi:putative hydrolase